ncbi:MAG: hypothetical protein A2W25_04605 [candidate division Zixibacteria bacterium RBG_16_53_22]|nr:MAG: hypothetical protein A2W25_04605 [candidate division Zixibacteria bacterium RBG_16_53_22]
MDWEVTFRQWAQPPSATEREKMENAERAIKKAIDACEALDSRNIRVFAQGSYRNRTNVRQDSDVDICVLCKDIFYFQLPEGYSRDQFGLDSPATYADAQYRADIESALVSHFGRGSVTTGNKAWDIHANTYRVDADVVACFEYRYYFTDGSFRKGTAVIPRSGLYIANYPDQNYENGKAKNDETNHRFRAAVRILKNLSNYMKENGESFIQLPSYLYECLTWNVPNEGFDHDAYIDDIRWILAHLCNETRTDETCNEWCEVNSFKYLFRPSQKWTRVEANTSLNSAWRYLGFN